MTRLGKKIKNFYAALKDNDRKLAEIKRKKEICGTEYCAVYDDIEARKQVGKKYYELHEQEIQLWIERWDVSDLLSKLNFIKRECKRAMRA